MSVRHDLDRLKTEHDLAARAVVGEKKYLREAEERLTNTLEARRVLQAAAEGVQRSAHAQIASVVTRCLEAVLGPDTYEFRVVFERKRGRTEARLVFVRNGEEVDPIGAAGGGAVDLASFALRVACLILSRPKRRRLLILDEPLKHLSADYRPAARELLLVLAKEMGLQIILVTHSPELVCGQVVEVSGS